MASADFWVLSVIAGAKERTHRAGKILHICADLGRADHVHRIARRLRPEMPSPVACDIPDVLGRADRPTLMIKGRAL